MEYFQWMNSAKEMWSWWNSNQSSNHANHVRMTIVDPLATLIRLATLSHFPVGTKIAFHNHQLVVQPPVPITQFLARWSQGDSRHDLHQLYPILIWCIQTYPVTKDKRMTAIYENVITGINMLIKTYEQSPLITHSLLHYQMIIQNHLNQTDGRIDEQWIQSPIWEQLRQQWSPDIYQIIVSMFYQYTSSSDIITKRQWYHAIEATLPIIESQITDTVYPQPSIRAQSSSRVSPIIVPEQPILQERKQVRSK